MLEKANLIQGYLQTDHFALSNTATQGQFLLCHHNYIHGVHQIRFEIPYSVIVKLKPETEMDSSLVEHMPSFLPGYYVHIPPSLEHSF
jgi:hypothetical protein